MGNAGKFRIESWISQSSRSWVVWESGVVTFPWGGASVCCPPPVLRTLPLLTVPVCCLGSELPACPNDWLNCTTSVIIMTSLWMREDERHAGPSPLCTPLWSLVLWHTSCEKGCASMQALKTKQFMCRMNPGLGRVARFVLIPVF